MAFNRQLPYVFGNSFDSLAGQEQGYNQTAIGTGLAQQARAQAAIDQQNQQAAEQRRQAEEDSRQQAALQYQFSQQQAQQQADAAANQWQKYTFSQQQQADQAAAAQRAKEFGENLDLEKEKVAAAREAQGIKSGAADLQNAIQGIDSGDITTPDDLNKLYPNLTKQQSDAAMAHLT